MTNPILAFLFLLIGSGEPQAQVLPKQTDAYQISKTAKKPSVTAKTKPKASKTNTKKAPKATTPKPSPSVKPQPPEVPENVLPVEPFSLSGKAKTAQDSYTKGDYTKAASLLAEYRKANPDDPNSYALGYLEAKSLLSAKKTSDAISRLEKLSSQEGPLQSEVSYLLATLYEDQGQKQKAREAYNKVARGSRRYDAARLSRARLASTQEECDEILAERFYWTDDRAKALSIQKSFAEKNKDKTRANALTLQLFREYPGTAQGDEAVTEALALQPGHEVLIGRLTVLLDKKKVGEAKSYVKFLEQKLGEKDPVVLEAQGDLAFQAKEWDQAIDLFSKAQKGNQDSARAMRRQANALSRKGDVEGALSLYEKVYEGKSKEVPRALLDAVRLLRDQERYEEARKLAKRAADDFDDAATKREALWVSGWLAWRADDFADAAPRFDALVSYTEGLGPAEKEFEDLERRKMGFHMRERALYWGARAYAAQKKLDEATTRYTTIVKEYPLSYYSHQAFDRLQELGAKELVSSLRVRQKDAKTLGLTPKEVSDDKDKKNWTSPEAPKGGFSVVDDPSVRAAVAFYGLGLVEEAINELKSQANQGTLSTDGGAFLGALALNNDGVFQGTWTLLWKWDFARYPGEPNGDSAGETAQERLVDLGWKIAYPRAYGEIVDLYSKKFDVPSEMVFAIMRAESTFRPEVVSPAKAVGLTQVLPTTANWIAKELLKTPKPSRAQLFEEETNIQLGSRFMKELLTLFQGNYAMAIASYNAGPGAGIRWYKRWKDAETDEWIEEIPYNETHGYTKKVLGSMGAYRYVWGDWSSESTRSLDLPKSLPSKLGTYNGKQM